MRRQARCWICGTVFQAERGSLPRGALFTCDGCHSDGLSSGVDRAELSRVLGERHGVAFVEVRDLDVEEEVLKLVPEDFARCHALLPVAIRERPPSATAKKPRLPGPPTRELVLAMVDPANTFALESLRRRTGFPVVACVAAFSDVAAAIEDLYLPLAIAEESIPE